MNKQEWYNKLSGLVQSWVTKNTNGKAVFSGVAAVIANAEADYKKHIDQTYIDKAELEYVQLHGKERSLEILPDESIVSYRVRIKRITNQSNFVELKYVVDGFLLRGESTFIEHTLDSGGYLNRNSFLNRNLLNYDVRFNAFTIVVDYQDSFNSDLIFENIVRAVNKNKAAGVVYRIIERVN
jgi:hypothetical protein